MSIHARSSKELFRVDDPEKALSALCSLKGTLLFWDTLRVAYKKVNNNEEIPDDYAGNIGYFFVQLGFLEKAGIENKYRLTQKAEQVCESRTDKARCRQLLGNALLSQDVKSERFREFLAFLGQPRKVSEITEKFERVGNTLKAWSEEAGLIAKEGEYYWSVKPSIRSIEEFWDKFLDTHKRLSRTRLPGVTSHFVRINDIRREMLPYLPPEEPRAFDKFMQDALKDQKYKSQIELSGAPISYVDREKLTPFVHKGKNYYFISLIRR